MKSQDEEYERLLNTIDDLKMKLEEAVSLMEDYYCSTPNDLIDQDIRDYLIRTKRIKK